VFLDPVQSYDNVYWAFKEIDENAHTTVIRFYEEQKEHIMKLDFDENFEMQIVYANALFETGKYYKHLAICDKIIEASIEYNIKYHRGEDIFYTTLFKKAVSYFNIGNLAASSHILSELIKLDPKDKFTIGFYKKCKRCDLPAYVKNARAIGILIFLISAMVIGFELLLFRPFYPEIYNKVWVIRTYFIGFGILTILLSDIYYRWDIKKEIEIIAKKRGAKKI
jgi:tetratricopeptide (TPR) repeat protein